MGLFDFFKKKKKIKEKKVEKKEIKKEEKEKVEARPLPRAKPEVRKPKKKISERACRILYSSHVTEKGTTLGEENKYLFKVSSKTNKIEIKKAIEGIYGIDVINVKVINIPKKKRRLGKQKGWRKGYKKAIVKVKKGQKIEILPR